jgi:hypothetical protein
VSGNDQYATIGSPIANPLVVLVVDENGSPFPNATVNWSVPSGGGTVAVATSTSDATGHAAMQYVAGATPGIATVAATLSDLWTATFSVYVEAPANRVQ